MDNVEQLIKESEVKPDVTDRLKSVPPDDIGEVIAILSKAINVVPYEKRIGGIWKITAIVGYVGKEEDSHELRIIWSRKFQEPLPPCSHIRLPEDEQVFAIPINGTQYRFNKVNGSYLGCTKATSTA